MSYFPLSLLLKAGARNKHLDGRYELMSGRVTNCFPVYKEMTSNLYLYTSASGLWIFCKEIDFDDPLALGRDFFGDIRNPAKHGGMTPDALPLGSWQRWDGSKWRTDASIAVTVADEVVQVQPSQAQPSPAHPSPCQPSQGPNQVQPSTAQLTQAQPAICAVVGQPQEDFADQAQASDEQAQPSSGQHSPHPWHVALKPGTRHAYLGGRYEMMAGQGANGFPVYKRMTSDHYLYTSSTEKWFVGGKAEFDKKFACSSGFIHNPVIHGGMMPDALLAGTWVTLDKKAWLADASIEIRTAGGGLQAPNVLHLTTGARHKDAGGQYELVFFKNAFPIFKNAASDHYMYTGKDGTWWIGGKACVDKSFDCSEGIINNSFNHGGMMPDVVPLGSWMSKGVMLFGVDASITVVQRAPNALQLKPGARHADLRGRFELMAGQSANGFPVYKRLTSNHYLFSGNDGKWCVGGKAEFDKKFKCSVGFIHNPMNHGGMMPDAMPVGTWQSTEAGVFVNDASVVITEADEVLPAPKALQLKPGKGRADLGGRYERMEGQRANGFPVYKRLTSDHYLYTSKFGTWMLGGRSEFDKKFRCSAGFIHNPLRHGGMMPDALPAGTWVPLDGRALLADASIEIRTVGDTLQAPNALFLTTGAQHSDAGGRYELMAVGQVANAFPIFKNAASGHYMYTGKDGTWWIGGKVCVGKSFDCSEGIINSSFKHGGMMPDLVPLGSWRSKGVMFFGDDASIKVVRETFEIDTTVAVEYQHDVLPDIDYWGGFALGPKVSYVSNNVTLAIGSSLVNGASGQVTGPVASGTFVGQGVAVQLPHNMNTVNCAFDDLTDNDPAAGLGVASDTHLSSLQRMVDDKEDFQPRSPFAGFFSKAAIVPLKESLQTIVPPAHHVGLFNQVSMKACKPWLASKYPETDENLRSYLVSYTTQLHPPEDSPYWGCNAALRELDRQKMEPWVPYTFALTTALRSLPEAEVLIAYRGYKKSPLDISEDFVKGGVITFSQFLSVAETLEPMQMFVGTEGPRTMLHLHLLKGYGGKRIKDFSFFPSESEILLEPNATFKIVSIVDLGAGLTMIECHQMPTADVIP